MLVLKRHSGESIRGETKSGEKFRLTFSKDTCGAIKVVIDAPRSMTFVRDELPPIIEPTIADVKPETVKAA